MLSRWVRTWDSALLRPLLERLSRAGVTPNMLTLASLALFIAAGVVIAQGTTTVAGGLLLLGGLADGLDGELARVSGTSSVFGGFLDSICDHAGDAALSLGIAWLYLGESNNLGVLLVFLALFSSMWGSQVRSRAGMVGIDTKDVGLVTRFERTLLLIVGIWSAHLLPALGVLAALNTIAAAQRVRHVIARVRATQQLAEQSAQHHDIKP